MDEQWAYLESDVIDIVRNVHNLRVLERNLIIAGLERKRMIESRQARFSGLYGEMDVAMSESRYVKSLEEGDRQVDELKEILQEEIARYRELPKSLQQSISEGIGLDLERINLQLL